MLSLFDFSDFWLLLPFLLNILSIRSPIYLVVYFYILFLLLIELFRTHFTLYDNKQLQQLQLFGITNSIYKTNICFYNLYLYFFNIVVVKTTQLDYQQHHFSEIDVIKTQFQLMFVCVFGS